MKKQIAPYVMPICTGIAMGVAMFGLVVSMSPEAWDYVWERM